VDPPAGRGGIPEFAHILSQDQRSQDVSYPADQIGPQAPGLVVFDQALEAPVTDGTYLHLCLLYGKAVRKARKKLNAELNMPVFVRERDLSYFLGIPG